MAPTPTQARPGPARTVVAGLAVTAVRAAVRLLPFGWLTGIIRTVNRGPAATRAEAERALYAVDNTSRLLPFRVACLERSLAGLVLLAARRRSVTWCLGVRQTPPVAMHAWLADTAGAPIAETEIMPPYRTILTMRPEPTGETPQ
jgi:transglutaminase superfamily protein